MDRRDEVQDGRLGMARQCFLELLQRLRSDMDPHRLVIELACGKHVTSPFSENLLADASMIVKRCVHNYGTRLNLDEIPDRQPFKLALLEEFLRLSGDPDFRAFYSSSRSFANGVSLGVNEKLPRTPAVFERKRKWRDYSGEQEPSESVRYNYPTAEANADVIERQFLAEEKLGAMLQLPMAEAAEHYGDRLRIASLGAIRKGDDSFRVTHDGTHGTGVNGRIAVRDQLASPTAGDLRQATRELEPTFVLAADVSRAHCFVKIREADWCFQACRVSSSSQNIWLNAVGTFGVSSIAMRWARLMGGLQRATFYLSGQLALFIMTYVDDILLMARGREAAEALAVALLFMAATGLPFSWKKCHGGTRTDRVGNHLDIQKRLLGVNANRSRWLVSWLGRTLEADRVNLADFSAVLGR